MIDLKTPMRTLAILELIAESRNGLTFSEIQAKSSLPKSSLHSLLNELVEGNYLEYNILLKQYFYGINLLKLGVSCISNCNILTDLKNELENISEETGETLHAAILSGRYASYILKIAGNEKSSIANVGIKLPAHCTALGKVLLSSLDEKEIRNLFSNVILEKYTDNTLTDIDKIIEEINIVKRNQYAIEKGEISSTISCISIPIFFNDKLWLAISVSIPNYKFTEEYIDKFIKILNKCRFKIEEKLKIVSI